MLLEISITDFWILQEAEALKLTSSYGKPSQKRKEKQQHNLLYWCAKFYIYK